jgi:transcriptional regulator
MKRFIWLLTIISMFTIVNCGGGGSSKEAKELLQKILQVVGIPYDIVVNICQDDNKNGICESMELQTKITLRKGDTFDDIWEKITLTEDGKYFLETRDPTKPILLELQDANKVTYDNGKFTIPFSGFKTYEQNETKELSVLAAMVDKGYFLDSELEAVRNLNNTQTQDKFYAKLLDALETNINTLRAVGMASQDAMLANLQEMATELIANGVKKTLPQDLNNCGANMTCVDNRLETMYNRVTISEEKASTIKETYTPPVATETPTSSGKKLLVSKEIEYEDYSYGDIKSDTTTTTTYEYEGNRVIKTKNLTVSTYNGREISRDEEICSSSYDSKGRYIEDICNETSSSSYGEPTTSTSRTTYTYKDNKIVSSYSYEDGRLEYKWEVIEWSNNKPSNIRETDYDENGTVTTSNWITTYTGDNPTHITSTSKDGTWESDRKFDNKKIPYYYDSLFETTQSYIWFWWTGKNNIIEEIIRYSDKEGIRVTYTQKNSIQYNSSDMPIKIDSYYTADDSNITYTYHITTTYEYIEAK